MKCQCQICNKKITWDNSYGLREFLICENCLLKLGRICNHKTMNVVFKLGELRKGDTNK